jgi:anaphase-promoting complex subunit 8
MGHEYIEMKNTHAAIESYRRAVDVNRKDYRAWYGLGQAYEVLDMCFYALYYYQRTAALKPYDPKMWQAVGTCYAKMNQIPQSIKAMKRALVAGAYYEQSADAATADHPAAGRKILDPDLLHQVALLYERMNDEDEAAAYMELTLQQESGEVERTDSDSDNEDADENSDDESTQRRSRRQRRRQKSRDDDNEVEAVGGTGVTATTSKARLWLARWAIKHGDLNRADQLAGELCQDGIEVEEAKALMRDIRARREGGG